MLWRFIRVIITRIRGIYDEPGSSAESKSASRREPGIIPIERYLIHAASPKAMNWGLDNVIKVRYAVGSHRTLAQEWHLERVVRAI